MKKRTYKTGLELTDKQWHKLKIFSRTATFPMRRTSSGSTCRRRMKYFSSKIVVIIFSTLSRKTSFNA
ncbi:MAG: hypothetical protein LBH00_10010, partial [Planctomycetaceae bacterium]|nr:hypothetical protein [Planctomycetaceae bacterium]